MYGSRLISGRGPPGDAGGVCFSPVESQVPLDGKAGGTPVDVNDFAHSRKQLLLNSPDTYLARRGRVHLTQCNRR